MVAQMMVEERESSPLEVADHIDKTKTLICALNLLSRNLPLPPRLFDAVSCIYGAAPAVDPVPGVTDDGVGGSFSAAVENVTVSDGSEISSGGDLMRDLEDAMAKQRRNCISGSGWTTSRENRLQSNVQRCLTELEELPTSRGEDLQSKCLLELYGLQPDTITGDVIFILHLKEHPKFKWKFNNLYVEHTLTLTEALCGFQFAITHLDGRQLLIKSNPGGIIKPDQYKAINDEGMPHYKRPFIKGRLFIHFNVDFPESGFLSPEKCRSLENHFTREAKQELVEYGAG